MLVFYVTKLDQAIGKYRKLEINLVIFKQRQKSLSANVRDEQFAMLKVIVAFRNTKVNRMLFKLLLRN